MKPKGPLCRTSTRHRTQRYIDTLHPRRRASLYFTRRGDRQHLFAGMPLASSNTKHTLATTDRIYLVGQQQVQEQPKRPEDHHGCPKRPRAAEAGRRAVVVGTGAVTP